MNVTSNPSRRRLCLLGCGGTIAMHHTDRGLEPSANINVILQAFPVLNELAQIDAVDILNKDSTNMRPLDWTTIANAVHERIADYDAFIITHGTDTMAYSAGALALSFGHALSVPIIFTGSQLPLVDFGTDARFNLENAFRVAIQAINDGIVEVMISFGHSILRGCRARKANEVDFEAFESPACEPLALLQHKVTFNSHAFDRDTIVSSDYLPEFKDGVFHMRLTPGISPDFLSAVFQSRKLTGVILESFGAGNVPNDSENNYTLIPVIRKLVDEYAVPIVRTTSFVGGRVRQDLYRAGSEADDAGAIAAGDLTSEMAAVKLMWLLAQQKTNDEIRSLMIQDYIGEVTPNDG